MNKKITLPKRMHSRGNVSFTGQRLQTLPIFGTSFTFLDHIKLTRKLDQIIEQKIDYIKLSYKTLFSKTPVLFSMILYD